MKLGLTGCRILIRNEKLITGSIVIDLDSGVIEQVREGSVSKREVDLLVELTRDYLVLPGFVDIHVHCRDGELAYKETLETCSRAAAAGGVVLLFDMPNTRPPLNEPRRVIERFREAQQKCIVEYRLHAGVPEDIDLVDEYYRIGVRSLKMFPEDFERLREEKKLELFLERLKRYDMLLVAHCEDLSIIRENEKIYERKFENHNKIRPEEAELAAVKELVKTCYRVGLTRVHITHVSSPRTVDFLLASRQLLPYLTFDVTPHHVLLSQEECLAWCETPGICKVNPPLRDRRARAELLYKLITGQIDCVVSDHAPHDFREKLEPYDKCPPGIPGLETTSLLLLDLWRQGMLDLLDVVRLYSGRPARIVRVQEPVIDSGYPAYVVVIAIGRKRVIRGREFKSKARYTPFEGWQLDVDVVLTIVRNRVAHVRESDPHVSKLLDFIRPAQAWQSA